MAISFSTLQSICDKFGIKTNGCKDAAYLFGEKILNKKVRISTRIDDNEILHIVGRVFGYGLDCLIVDCLYFMMDDIVSAQILADPCDLSPFSMN